MPFVRSNPPEWESLLAQQAKPRTGLHVTDCLGCPRRRALSRENVPIDLTRLEARLFGTLIHSALSTVNPETAEVPVSGVLFGLQIVGSIDRIDNGFTVDYKAGEDKGNGRALPDAPYPEEVWQQECYRYLLYERECPTLGWRIYYRWGKDWYVYEHIGPVWTEDKLGAFRPHGGAFTAAEIAGQCASDAPASSLPLVGATQKIGRATACDWCEVGGPCREAGNEVEL